MIEDQIAPYHEYVFIAAYNDARSRKMAHAHVTRARRMGVYFDHLDVGAVYHKQGGICGICRQAVAFEVFTIDHVIPLSKGGTHQIGNLKIAHHACNSTKRDRISIE